MPAEQVLSNTQPAVRATQVLMAEHVVIDTVLDCLEKLTDEFARSRKLDVATARDILDVLGTFADKCHHGKEENCLFPVLFKKGLPREVGPVAVMLSEHEEGRAEIAGMKTAVAAATMGDREGAERFVHHARAYVELLRDHIAKENNVLFPMADGMMTAAEQADLLKAFGNVELHDVGAGTHERCLALVEDLVKRLGVTPSVRPLAQGGGCCGHGAHACH